MATLIDTSHDCETGGDAAPGAIPVQRKASSSCCGATLAEGGTDENGHTCTACGQPATIQCDAPTKRRGGTCDRHLCADCATATGPDTHLCPTHAASGVGAQQTLEL